MGGVTSGNFIPLFFPYFFGGEMDGESLNDFFGVSKEICLGVELSG